MIIPIECRPITIGVPDLSRSNARRYVTTRSALLRQDAMTGPDEYNNSPTDYKYLLIEHYNPQPLKVTGERGDWQYWLRPIGWEIIAIFISFMVLPFPVRDFSRLGFKSWIWVLITFLLLLFIKRKKKQYAKIRKDQELKQSEPNSSPQNQNLK